jgi:hypothetical protein
VIAKKRIVNFVRRLVMSGKTRTRSWKHSHLRIAVAVVFCLTALALGAFRISESAGAAG